MTVSEFKEWVSNIDSKFDNREIVLHGFSSYSTDGYNPVFACSIHGKQVVETFPKDKENLDKGKLVAVLNIC